MTRITEINHTQMVTQLVKPAQDIVDSLVRYPERANAWHMGTGVAGEAGELLDAVKKHVVYGKAANVENVIEELGDLEFYMEGLRQHFGISRERTLESNMNKLLKGKNARYASGSYTDKEAQTRNDKFNVPYEDIVSFISENCAKSTVFQLGHAEYLFSVGTEHDYCYYVDAKGTYRHSASITNLDLVSRVKPEWFKE